MRLCELKGKTVINDTDCCILGFVIDIDFDPASGCILAIIVPGPARLCGFLGRDYEYVIPFKCIRTIGPDIILVSICPDKVKQKCILPVLKNHASCYKIVIYMFYGGG